MFSPSDYRNYARECMQAAASSHDPEYRKTLIQMAKLWMNTALETESSIALIDDDAPVPPLHKL